MKKYPKYQLRVSEEMLATLVAVGSTVVREWLDEGVREGFSLKKPSPVKTLAVRIENGAIVPPAGAARPTMAGDWSNKEDMEQFLADRPKDNLMEKVLTEAPVPGWRARLEQQLAEREKRGFVSSGSAAPSAVAAVSAPSGDGDGRVAPGARYAPMREKTAEEKAEAMAKLGGLKLMPQMKKADPYALGDPEAPEE